MTTKNIGKKCVQSFKVGVKNVRQLCVNFSTLASSRGRNKIFFPWRQFDFRDAKMQWRISSCTFRFIHPIMTHHLRQFTLFDLNAFYPE